MVKVTATIKIEGAEEIEETREVLEMLGEDVDDVTVIRRPIGDIRISGFQKDDRAGELLSIDPEGIIFNDEPVKMTGTDKQNRILREARKSPDHSIGEVAEDAGTSTSYAKKVIASATPEDFPEVTEDDEEDDPWDIVGTDQSKTSRALSYPDTDTRQFEVLVDLGTESPATMEEVAARSDVGKSPVSSALSHLYDKKMIEAKKRRDVNYYYLSEDGEEYLESEGYDAGPEHQNYREMFGG